MKNKLALAIVSSLSFLLFTGGAAAAQGQYVSGSTGVDVSWPNCNASIPNSSFGVVGVNNGAGYSTNPCLTKQAGRFSNLSLYVNTGWYDKSSYINPSSPKLCSPGDNNCLAYNYGYNAGLYAFNSATSAGARSQTWWLDVESINTWNSDVNQNRSSLQGEYDALKASGILNIGAYSTTAEWNSISGSWLNGWPSWGATTWTTAAQAQKYCTGHEFTGGPSWLMQFKSRQSKLDQDVAC